MQARFTDRRLKHRIEQQELLAIPMREGSNHALRHSQNAGLLFEHGEGGYEQFISDFYTRMTRMNGLMHLGFHEVFQSDDADCPSQTEIKSHVAAILSLTNVTVEDVDHIIAAHSQGPLATISFIIGQSINEPKTESRRIQFNQPNSQNIIFYRDGNESLYARVQFDYFPIVNFEGSAIGVLPGPIESTYQIVERVCGQAGNRRKVWGYELLYVETSSEDIANALGDQRFDPSYVLQSYCNPLQVEDFKRMVMSHMQHLVEVDLLNKVIYPPLDQHRIEVGRARISPEKSRFGLFANLKNKAEKAASTFSDRFRHK